MNFMQNASRNILIGVLLVISSVVINIPGTVTQAQSPGIKTDYGVYPEPTPPTLPAAGGKFVDPTFGTTVMRLTDSNDGSINTTAYSYWPTFNKNSTRLFVLSDWSPKLYSFNPVNFTISNKRAVFTVPPPVGTYPDSEDLIWSGVNADVILGHDGLRLWSYNVSSNTYTLLKNFSGLVTTGAVTLLQMSRSLDDNVFSFHLRNASGNTVGYIAWRQSDNFIYKVDTSDVNETELDKTGQYLVVTTEQSGSAGDIEVKTVNLTTLAVNNLTDGPPDYAPGHHDCGQGSIIGADNWLNRLLYRNLATPHQLYSIFDMPDWTIGCHLSFLADDEAWILQSSFYINNGLSSTGKFKNELFQIATDGSKQVRRLVHTHSIYDPTVDPNAYWATPRGNISRDGQYAAFASNWGVAGGRIDVFIVKIPPPGGGGGGGGSVENVIWTNLFNTTATGNSLQKTGGHNDGTPDGGGYSQQAITSGNGYLEFTTTEANKLRFCGLTSDPNNNDYSTIDFCIKPLSSSYVEVRENNVYKSDTSYVSGDVFRISIESGVVKYYKNGTVFYTSANTPTYPLKAQANFVLIGSSITNAVISTGSTGGGGGGGGSVQNVAWTNLFNTTATGNSLQKTGGHNDGTPDGGGYSQQAITSGNGYLEFTTTEANKLRFCGLTSDPNNNDYSTIDFCIKPLSSSYVEVRENNVYKSDTSYVSGDVFRISIESGVVKYYKNGTVFYTSANTPTYPLKAQANFVLIGSSITNAIIAATTGGTLGQVAGMDKRLLAYTSARTNSRRW